VSFWSEAALGNSAANIDWEKPMFDSPSLAYVVLLLSLLSLLYSLGGEV
jgi:hypothetical protein